MDDNSPEENKRRFDNDRIFRKSLLSGQSAKIARDNIKLRENLRKMAKNFLKYKGNDDQKSSG